MNVIGNIFDFFFKQLINYYNIFYKNFFFKFIHYILLKKRNWMFKKILNFFTKLHITRNLFKIFYIISLQFIKQKTNWLQKKICTCISKNIIYEIIWIPKFRNILHIIAKIMYNFFQRNFFKIFFIFALQFIKQKNIAC